MSVFRDRHELVQLFENTCSPVGGSDWKGPEPQGEQRLLVLSLIEEK